MSERIGMEWGVGLGEREMLPWHVCPVEHNGLWGRPAEFISVVEEPEAPLRCQSVLCRRARVPAGPVPTTSSEAA